MMPPEQTANPLIHFLIPYAFIFFIFYLIVFRPRKADQLKRKNMLSSLKKNDEVITTGGIHGTVVNVKDTTVSVRIDDNVKMEVDKEAIATILNATSQNLQK